ncbi:uncharacterized protein LOC111529568 isoform X2 [Piliocolobus tephrosceles]|uniref:uncharacterized protein LOC111529568 isoform X2 n=1 Tax=Piliocolobus tephrosceles TaxID=591936 RepID=UPI000E6B3963|nr:uncharacterized protein LOC111529568 isoform X2 [Piliocolobus tephrosceles]XP_023052250.2 uncharacterized protein LOC111529568 isoform X2 [Piliocolobus tephrosceles]
MLDRHSPMASASTWSYLHDNRRTQADTMMPFLDLENVGKGPRFGRLQFCTCWLRCQPCALLPWGSNDPVNVLCNGEKVSPATVLCRQGVLYLGELASHSPSSSNHATLFPGLAQPVQWHALFVNGGSLVSPSKWAVKYEDHGATAQRPEKNWKSEVRPLCYWGPQAGHMSGSVSLPVSTVHQEALAGFVKNSVPLEGHHSCLQKGG